MKVLSIICEKRILPALDLLAQALRFTKSGLVLRSYL